MSAVEIMVQDAVVRVVTEEIEPGVYRAHVVDHPEVEAHGRTREDAIRKVATRAQHAVDLVA